VTTVITIIRRIEIWFQRLSLHIKSWIDLLEEWKHYVAILCFYLCSTLETVFLTAVITRAWRIWPSVTLRSVNFV